MKRLRFLLLPFSFIYGVVLLIRHFLYDRSIFKVTSFNKPVIVIGNLIVGGAGKSPMTEYLIRMLSPHYKVATLSRGYGRITKGFLEVQADSLVENVGDEPLQFKKKFPNITVADCESRVEGLRQLMPHHDVFILDDAFQHRALKGSLTILLFDFNSLRQHKLLLPAGDYRDLYTRRNHADVIVITKSPAVLDQRDQERAITSLQLRKDIPVFFSIIAYGAFTHVLNGSLMAMSKKTSFIVITGIANPQPFIEQLRSEGDVLQVFVFKDHHPFSVEDIKKIRRYWDQQHRKQILVTTEKDATRLRCPDLYPLLVDLPLYYIPIETVFHQPNEGDSFDDFVRYRILN